MQPPVSDEDLRSTLAAYRAAEGNISAVARSTGMSRSAVRERLRAASRRGIEPEDLPQAAAPPQGFEIAQRVLRLDRQGQVSGQSVTHRQARGENYAAPQGHRIKGESALVDGDNRLIARWIKTGEARTDEWIEALRQSLSSFDGRARKIAAPRYGDDDLLTAYIIPDAHIGLRAWRRETGEAYDLDIAREDLLDGVARLAAQSRRSSRALVIWLGDTTHGNDSRNATPKSGHVLDVDGRWPKVLRAACDIAIETVSAAARRHKHVLTRFLPGNHDSDAAHALTLGSSYCFARTPRIVVDQDPGLHFYHRFGAVLIGATHGHTMPPERMAMMMAADRARDWGETVHKHFFFGHVHHVSARGVGPVRVESFNSPAGKDGFAAGAGHRAPRTLSAITFHRRDGQIGRHEVSIAPARDGGADERTTEEGE